MSSVDIKQAVNILSNGGLVAIPTETVYGLAADAANQKAVEAIFQAKLRPHTHPLIVHLASIDQLNDWARDVSPLAFKLAEAFWPGPLTLILKKQPHVLDIVTGGQDTIGVRIPNHPVALAVLREFGGGLAAPSANQFTHVSPTTARAVAEELGDRIDMILDGGACTVGLESTILDVSGDAPVILRPGMLSAAQLSAVAGVAITMKRQDHPGPRVPGMHHLHYAPQTKTEVVTREALLVRVAEPINTAIITWEAIELPSTANITIQQLSNDPVSYAHDLYQTLRELDHQSFQRILIQAVPETVEWAAIRDRLEKAGGNR
jgi:L-threonylcarbamoyladenylate synthase